MKHATGSNPRSAPGQATLGTFVSSVGTDGRRHQAWIAPIAQCVDVVVGDLDGVPSPVGIAKAVSIVQSRAYLERRAMQLLIPLTKELGCWRLLTIDFGAEARVHDCEFLMCFAFEAAHSNLSITSPRAAVGFALSSRLAEDPLFVLTLKTAVGFPP